MTQTIEESINFVKFEKWSGIDSTASIDTYTTDRSVAQWHFRSSDGPIGPFLLRSYSLI